VAALADIKQLVVAGAPTVPGRATARRTPTHKNKGNHGGNKDNQGGRPSLAPAGRPPQAGPPAPEPGSGPRDRADGWPSEASSMMAPSDDAMLFRRAMSSVTPLKQTVRRATAPTHGQETPDILRQRRRHAVGEEAVRPAALSDQFAPALSDLEEGWFLRDGHGPDVLKKLRSGKWPVQASLDLHGATLDDARERLDRFLHSCLAHDLRCVLVVHGKGYGSEDGESVLKSAARRWLAQLPGVIAYTESHPAQGGSGALQVLLKTSR